MGTCSVRDGICKAKRLDIGRGGGGGGGVDSRYKTLLSIPLLLQNFRHLSQLSS